MKKYEVKLTIKVDDVLDDWSADDLATALKEDIHYASYGQLNVEHAEAKEVTE